MNLIDFIIGALIANAIPHLIFGLTKTHFLGMFGYTSKGNISYAVLQFIIAISIFCYNYEYSKFLENGYLIGAVTVLVLYFIFGNILVKFYGKRDKTTNN
ncbi:hypothetical protein [uncultured Kordia sp.]|uniref:hypothetical protein n=1 Tax=uncultured Kordia sp. TaxID=507699 RepID=UPI00261332FB|nr:hypothetical protein [uncultured Kordia sp.]